MAKMRLTTVICLTTIKIVPTIGAQSTWLFPVRFKGWEATSTAQGLGRKCPLESQQECNNNLPTTARHRSANYDARRL